MTLKIRFAPLSFVLLHFAFLALLASVPMPASSAESHDQTARYLAGLAPRGEGRIAELSETASWRRHKARLDEAFEELETQTLSRLRRWSEKAVPEKPSVLFYPFSGPDFLFAEAVHPEAKTYVLVGLEPVGALAMLRQGARGPGYRGLDEFRHSLRSFLGYSFFRTKDMKDELRENHYQGVTPVLLAFIARSGRQIISSEPLELTSEGGIAQKGKGGRHAVPGMRITFSRPRGQNDVTTQVLYYFQADLSNNGLKRNGISQFVGQSGEPVVFVKSASYLMHSNGFSAVRKLITEHARHLVQDDSGIPLNHIPRDIFDIQPWGNYLGPIDVFPDMNQPEMKRLFSGGRAAALDFGIGYRWRRGQSNLIVATRRSGKAQAGQPAQ
jgi:hypothetical protein